MLQLKTAVMGRGHGNNILENTRIPVFYTFFSSPIGLIYVASIYNILCNISIGAFAKKRFEKYFSTYPFLDLEYSPLKLEKYVVKIINYLESGKHLSINSAIILQITNFQLSVWEQTVHIPFGETRTYKWIAKEIDKPHSSRAVGNALGENPLPLIIPCHRVIKSNGQTGGFTGGKKIKEHLLSLERSVKIPSF